MSLKSISAIILASLYLVLWGQSEASAMQRKPQDTKQQKPQDTKQQKPKDPAQQKPDEKTKQTPPQQKKENSNSQQRGNQNQSKQQDSGSNTKQSQQLKQQPGGKIGEGSDSSKKKGSNSQLPGSKNQSAAKDGSTQNQKPGQQKPGLQNSQNPSMKKQVPSGETPGRPSTSNQAPGPKLTKFETKVAAMEKAAHEKALLNSGVVSKDQLEQNGDDPAKMELLEQVYTEAASLGVNNPEKVKKLQDEVATGGEEAVEEIRRQLVAEGLGLPAAALEYGHSAEELLGIVGAVGLLGGDGIVDVKSGALWERIGAKGVDSVYRDILIIGNKLPGSGLDNLTPGAILDGMGAIGEAGGSHGSPANWDLYAALQDGRITPADFVSGVGNNSSGGSTGGGSGGTVGNNRPDGSPDLGLPGGIGGSGGGMGTGGGTGTGGIIPEAGSQPVTPPGTGNDGGSLHGKPPGTGTGTGNDGGSQPDTPPATGTGGTTPEGGSQPGTPPATGTGTGVVDDSKSDSSANESSDPSPGTSPAGDNSANGGNGAPNTGSPSSAGPTIVSVDSSNIGGATWVVTVYSDGTYESKLVDNKTGEVIKTEKGQGQGNTEDENEAETVESSGDTATDPDSTDEDLDEYTPGPDGDSGLTPAQQRALVQQLGLTDSLTDYIGRKLALEIFDTNTGSGDSTPDPNGGSNSGSVMPGGTSSVVDPGDPEFATAPAGTLTIEQRIAMIKDEIGGGVTDPHDQ